MIIWMGTFQPVLKELFTLWVSGAPLSDIQMTILTRNGLASSEGLGPRVNVVGDELWDRMRSIARTHTYEASRWLADLNDRLKGELEPGPRLLALLAFGLDLGWGEHSDAPIGQDLVVHVLPDHEADFGVNADWKGKFGYLWSRQIRRPGEPAPGGRTIPLEDPQGIRLVEIGREIANHLPPQPTSWLEGADAHLMRRVAMLEMASQINLGEVPLYQDDATWTWEVDLPWRHLR
ncbi:MAG: hypothetical protein M0Z66_04955 [Thermaerobacter sp.]|nr:hypothetical protein [Thermaerobacter sp.]